MDTKLDDWRKSLVETYIKNSSEGHGEPDEGWFYLIAEEDLKRTFGRIMEVVELLGIEGKQAKAFRNTLSRAFWDMGGEERESIHVDTLAEVRKVAPIRTTLHM